MIIIVCIYIFLMYQVRSTYNIKTIIMFFTHIIVNNYCIELMALQCVHRVTFINYNFIKYIFGLILTTN